MTGLDPRFVAVLCLIFIAVGIFNIIMGRRRLRAAQAQGLRLAWYKQTALLTGIEYILLSLMFLLSTSISAHWFPTTFTAFIYPLYLAFLFTSAALAGVIIYMAMQDNRRRRAAMINPTEQNTQNTPLTDTLIQKEMTPEEREASLQRRRERRKKAAEARRRRAGKA